MDVASQLNAALAGRYAIEREIGRGGMATVYLAHDVRHQRHVALKVLDSQLAASLGSERFLAEIRVTARLQHPNVLPLFDSGEANGLLFYVMPFVVGESLRAWLDREGPLPVSDAMRIASAIASLVLGIYAFTMPACKPAKSSEERSWASAFGLDAFVLFKQRKMAVFFIFAMLLGAALQITNAFGKPFLDDFHNLDQYKNSFAVTHGSVLISISQISETLFILSIPFFLNRFGIKKVMLMSMFAWVFRFGLFGIGNPGTGLILLILSMIIYGMAFDFFNISGSLFVEKEADIKIRASAQGLFMLMTNGIGAFLGGWISGMVVDHFTVNSVKDWQSIWFSFAGYALVLGLIFPFVFKYRHDRGVGLEIKH